MSIYTTTVAGDTVTINAPRPGQFDRAAFERDLPAGGTYGLDVETTALDADLDQHRADFRVRLVQLATETVAWVLDPSDLEQRRAMRQLMVDDTTTFASHTAMDAISIHKAFGVEIFDRNIDTHVLGAIAHPGQAGQGGLGIKALAARHIGPELEQAEQMLHQRFSDLWSGAKNAKQSVVQANGWSMIELTDPVYLVYAGLDAIVAVRLARCLRELTKTPDEVIDLDLWLAGRLAHRQSIGYRVDQSSLTDLRDACEQATKAPSEFIEATTGVKPSQGVKLAAWLTERGVTGATTNSGQLSLSKKHLPTLADAQEPGVAKDVLDALVEVRKHQDALGKAKGLIKRSDDRGRVHPSFKAVGAPTARMSCSGFNLQAVAKDDVRQRGLFIPDEGSVLIGADFDQIELRVVAALAREQAMYKTVLSGGDLHQLTADRIGVERKVAKAVNFMIVYGGGGQAVAAKTGLPVDECRGHVERFKAAYPAITQLALRCAAQPKITTITGRVLDLPSGPEGPRTYANINYLIQSSSRDLMVMAWRRFAEQYGDCVWLAIHDEIIAEVPADRADEASQALEAAMNFSFKSMPVSAAAVPLIDENGKSRWMSIDRAEHIRETSNNTHTTAA